MHQFSVYQSRNADLLSLIYNQQKALTKLPRFNTKSYKKNDYIYLPHHEQNSIYLIEAGRVKIVTHQDGPREIIKSVLHQGDFFGELSFLGHSDGNNFAIAMENTTLLSLSKEEFGEWIKEEPRLILILLKALGNRLVDMERRLESLVFRSSRSRIIDFLENEVVTRGQRVGYEMLVRKFFTHQEIANLTATSRQTVTTVLGELRSKNILVMNRHRLLIRDMDLLIQEAA